MKSQFKHKYTFFFFFPKRKKEKKTCVGLAAACKREGPATRVINRERKIRDSIDSITSGDNQSCWVFRYKQV